MDRLEIASECRIRIGEYVGRNVFLLLTGTSRTPILARNSLVFAFFGDGFLGWDAEEIYESLVENGVLGITVAGENCEHRFDQLLNFLSTYRTSYHINTGMFRDRSFYEAAINFLAGSIPGDPNCLRPGPNTC